MIGKLFSFVSALALVCLGLTASAYGVGVHVPIHGPYSGTAAFTSSNTVAFNGTGISSLLGRSANQGIAVISGPDSSIPGGLDNVNTETFTAANGDAITVTSVDVAVPVAPGVVHGSGSWTVSGGTGRFANATGNGTLDGYADFNQGTFTFRLDGMISTPNGG